MIEKVEAVVEGLTILKSYGSVELGAEHDEFFAGAIANGAHAVVSDEHKVKLEELGWRYMPEFLSWRILV